MGGGWRGEDESNDNPQLHHAARGGGFARRVATIIDREETLVRTMNRRELVTGAGTVVLAGTASSTKVYAEPARANLATRRPIGSMQANDPMLASYRLAVERMKALPASDPRSWESIAQIHNNNCPHGNWFFLPWHRAYLISFERACRQISGNENFALPYWDWTEQPRMPAAFTAQTVGGRPNALFDNTREMPPGASLRASAIGAPVITRLLAETDFENFGSTRPTGQNSTEARWLRAPGRTTALEAGPHNSTHATIGGDMGDMLSPRDPIFWLHHANVDRMWARWTAQGRANTAESMWATFPFNGIFWTPQGATGTTPFNVGVSELLDHRAWGYTYQGLPPGEQAVARAPQAPLPQPRVVASVTPTGVATLNAVLTTRVPIAGNEAGPAPQAPPGAGSPPGDDPNAILRGDAPLEPRQGGAPAPGPAPGAAKGAAPRPRTVLERGRVFAILDGMGARSGNAATFNVFLNCPYLTPKTPESDPHFVGTYGLFALQNHAQHAGVNVQIELTETIARLRRTTPNFGAELDVQLLPVEARGGTLELNVQRINIAAL
jgi:tyrosinase